jgi:hypothetical protein
MLRCAASFVIAAYPKVRLIPYGFARLACELFTKPSEIRLFTRASYLSKAARQGMHKDGISEYIHAR